MNNAMGSYGFMNNVLHMSVYLWYLKQIIYSPKKETQHVKNIIYFKFSNIILNTEISITLH